MSELRDLYDAWPGKETMPDELRKLVEHALGDGPGEIRPDAS